MREFSFTDRGLYASIQRRQDRLWDRLMRALIDRLAEASDVEGPVDPSITQRDLDEDLWFGRS